MQCHLNEVAFTVSPVGWKLIKLFSEEDLYSKADEYLQGEGWQLWHWRSLSSEQVVSLEHWASKLSEEDYRLIKINNYTKKGESVGLSPGPFDLVLCSGTEVLKEHWMHIDPEYVKFWCKKNQLPSL